jgi:hypothetical protein
MIWSPWLAEGRIPSAGRWKHLKNAQNIIDYNFNLRENDLFLPSSVNEFLDTSSITLLSIVVANVSSRRMPRAL